jgi:cellulose 1,4-beta-cellobiosidase
MAPPAPTGLAAAASNAGVIISWNAVPAASRYVIRRSTSPGGPYTVLSNTVTDLSYTDSTSTLGTRYYYAVSGINIAGESPLVEVSVRPTPQVKIQYKTGDTNTADNVIRPQIEIVNTGKMDVPLSQVTLRYWYTNESGMSQTYWCDYAAVACANISTRFMSVLPAVTGADTYLEFAFGASTPSIGVGANSGEILSRVSKIDWTNYNEQNDYSYLAQTSYADTMRMTAYWNGQLIWGTEPVPAPAPTGLAATAGDKQAKLVWNEVPGVSSYNVYRSQSGSAAALVGSATLPYFINTGLTNGTTYTYYVKSVTALGEGPASSSVSAKPIAVPAQVTGLKATAGTAQVSLTWTAVTGATSYNIKRATSASGPFAAVGTATTTSYVAKSLTKGTTYYFVVSGVNASGEGPNSAVVSAVPK